MDNILRVMHHNMVRRGKLEEANLILKLLIKRELMLGDDEISFRVDNELLNYGIYPLYETQLHTMYKI